MSGLTPICLVSGGARGVWYGYVGGPLQIVDGTVRAEVEIFVPSHHLTPPHGEKELAATVLRQRLIFNVLDSTGKAMNELGLRDSPESIVVVGVFPVEARKFAVWMDVYLPKSRMKRLFKLLAPHHGRSRALSEYRHLGGGYWGRNRKPQPQDVRARNIEHEHETRGPARQSNTLDSDSNQQRAQKLPIRKGFKRREIPDNDQSDELVGGVAPTPSSGENSGQASEPSEKKVKTSYRSQVTSIGTKVGKSPRSSKNTAHTLSRNHPSHKSRAKTQVQSHNTAQVQSHSAAGGYVSNTAVSQPIAGPSGTSQSNSAPTTSHPQRAASPIDIIMASASDEEMEDAENIDVDGDEIMVDAPPLPVQWQAFCVTTESMVFARYQAGFFGLAEDCPFTFACPPAQVSNSHELEQQNGTTQASEAQNYIATAPSSPPHRAATRPIARDHIGKSTTLLHEPAASAYESVPVVAAANAYTARVRNKVSPADLSNVSPDTTPSTPSPARPSQATPHDGTRRAQDGTAPNPINTSGASGIAEQENVGERIIEFFIVYGLFIICAAAMWVVVWRWITETP